MQADLQRLYGIAEWRVADASWLWFRAIIHDLTSNPDSRTHELLTT